MLVRIKKINYRSKPAIAVFFQNMTKHVEQMKIEAQNLEQTNRNATLESYTSTISHEFRTPLSTSLMFLEGILQSTQDGNARHTLQLIISQLHLLLCLVNDVLDIKLIESGKFEPKLIEFSPLETLLFIKDMFSP